MATQAARDTQNAAEQSGRRVEWQTAQMHHRGWPGLLSNSDKWAADYLRWTLCALNLVCFRDFSKCIETAPRRIHTYVWGTLVCVVSTPCS